MLLGESMKRKIYEELIEWKNNIKNNKPLMILGVRQSGKTYIIKEFIKNEFKKYKEINLKEDTNVVQLYEGNATSDEKYYQLKMMIDFDFDQEDSILFVDEIQESEELIAELKYFCEKHNNVRIVCAGSLLGVKLKRLKTSFPVGKVWMKYLYPMDFEEFLMAYNRMDLIDYIKKCYAKLVPISEPLHNMLLDYYRIYLVTGGMPESVKNMVDTKNDYIKYNKNILSDIITAYLNDMKHYVTSEQETLKIQSIYKSIPSQLNNASKKFQYSLVNENARSREYAVSADWLENSNMVLKCKKVNLPEMPLEGYTQGDTFKYYLSDVGILNNLLKMRMEDIILDKKFIYKGIIAENYVANQLKSSGLELYYWKNDNGTAEVDFLIDTGDGVVPIEVKSSNNTQSKSLKVYNEMYKPAYSIRLSTKNFGYNSKTKIKSIPLYAAFLIVELTK